MNFSLDLTISVRGDNTECFTVTEYSQGDAVCKIEEIFRFNSET